MDDVGLVETILDLTSFDLLDGSSDVRGDGAGLGGGHETLRAKNFTETADNTHHVGRGDDDVETEPVFLRDLFDHVQTAGEISACVQSFLKLRVLRKDEDFAGLAGAVRENDGAADLLVSVTGVDAELDVGFDGLVELGGGGLHDQIHGLVDVVLRAAIIQLAAVLIFFTSEQCNYPP